MSAVEALKAAIDAGVSVTLDGGDLVLHASAEPPRTVLSGLSRHKATIVDSCGETIYGPRQQASRGGSQ